MDNHIQDRTVKAGALSEEVRYFYVVHGVIPELMPDVAYKRASGTRERDRKTLKSDVGAIHLGRCERSATT